MIQTNVLVDNDRVRIVEVNLQPGEKLEMHSHGPYVAYSMSSARVRFTFPDGTSREADLEKGKARYSEGVTHTVENIGSTELHNLDIELKK
jgi:mannose-6-phosphate isomerase-like protein (cupin superfamily)